MSNHESKLTVDITIGDRTITVTPVKVAVLPDFLRAVEPIAADLSTGDIMGALARPAENLIAATALGAGVERSWLDEQEVDVLVELAAAVLEVNADFFARRLTPALLKAAEALAVIGGTGLLPASVVPGSDTATP